VYSPGPIVVKRTYPWTDKHGDYRVTYRLMDEDDAESVRRMVANQPEVDRAFLRMDVTDPAVVADWLHHIRIGRTVTVLGDIDGQVVGYGSLHHNEVLWTSHMAEIRLMVDSEFRSLGIGSGLAAELFYIAKEMRLDKVFCQIPNDRAGVRKMFEDLGFNAEAMLSRWLLCGDGQYHDLLVMARDIEDFGA